MAEGRALRFREGLGLGLIFRFIFSQRRVASFQSFEWLVRNALVPLAIQVFYFDASLNKQISMLPQLRMFSMSATPVVDGAFT